MTGEHGPEEGRTNTERWLLTYADMITLLMIFFIVLYAFSKLDAAKYQQLALSLQAALSGDPLPRGLPNSTNNALITTAPSPALSPQVGAAPAGTPLTDLQRELQQVITANRGEAEVQMTPAGVDISFQGDPVYFASASAQLTPAFRQLLSQVAPVLKQVNSEIWVEGYTNDLPLVSTKYPTAWELSAARAIHVLRYLTEVCGLPPHQLQAVAYGQWHPKVPNDTPQDLQLNRTVDILVTADPPPGLDEGGPDVAPPGQGP